MFTQRDIVTGRLIAKLNDLPTGGGSSGVVVVDYDAADPANYITQTLTLADFVPVEGSAIIDAANNQIAVGTPIVVQAGYSYQYIAAKLDKIPTEGTVRLDFSNYENYSLGLITKNQVVSLDRFMSDLLLNGWYPYQQSWQVSAIVNTLNGNLDDVLHLKSKVTDKPDGSPTIDESIQNVSSLPNLNMTFTISNMLEHRLAKLGMTYRELVDYIKVMAGFSEEEAIALASTQRAIRALISGSLFMILPDGVTEMYIVLRPKPSNQSTTIDPTWTASVEMNASYISEWKVPEDTADGTYLRINGQCTLLGHKCFSGDVMLLCENKTKGILIKGGAIV